MITQTAPETESKLTYGLTEQEKQQWENDGFFIRKHVFSEQECDALRQRVEEIALMEEQLPSTLKPHIQLNAMVRDKLITDKKGIEAVHSVRQPYLYDNLFRNHARDPRVTDAVSDLIGPDLATHSGLVIFKAPGIGLPFPWHQDYWYSRISFDTPGTVGTWQALDEARVDNGCLWVIPGSHKRGILPHDELPGPQQDEFKEARMEKKEDGIPVEIPTGSVLFFHSHLLHRSTHNHSSRFRRTYVVHYLNSHAIPRNKHGQRPILWVRGSRKPFPGCIHIATDEEIKEFIRK